MPGLWKAVLPVLQEINTYGGNFTSAFICRAVIDEIDRLAANGDAAMLAKAGQLRALLANGRWPADFQTFNAFFETYHEALFYVLACRKGVPLEHIREVKGHQTPDFCTTIAPVEQFEIKTIDFTGGAYAYKPIMEEGLAAGIAAADQARQKGIGIAVRPISPHGDARNSFESVERVMRQIDGNVKAGQFAGHPTFLVVPMIRTNVRTRAEEILPQHHDHAAGGDVSGHLWTIAAHEHGAPFLDADKDDIARSLGALQRAGILRDHPYVRGIIFLHTEWSDLPGSDSPERFPDKAFGLFGVWNDAWEPPHAVEDTPIANGVFNRVCDNTIGSKRSL